jgi:HNH endonuclease
MEKKNIEYIKTESNCHEVVSHACRNGYPCFYFNRKVWSIHRYIYMMKVGESNFNEDWIIRHTCDNKLCINPEHLIHGSKLDNVNDMLERNRMNKKGTTTTENDVRLIRGWYESGFKTQVQLAELFNLSRWNIRQIISKERWKHVK